MSSLPYDILQELLYKLPVKTLLRFQGVSKQLHSLISDPKFAEKRAEINNNQRILWLTPGRFRSLDVTKSLDSKKASFTKLRFPGKIRYNATSLIIGSCNGLVCLGLHEYKDFSIWNPATRAYKRLPNPEPDIQFESPNRNVYFFEPQYIYGFGYDSSTDDYKVVVATRGRKPDLVKVFSMKTNSWRNIQDSNEVTIYTGHSKEVTIYTGRQARGLLFNGALHWLVPSSVYQSPGLAILAFDLAAEKFRRFEKSCGGGIVRLEVVEGCLSLNIRGCNNDLELLVMKEYGVESSWERLTKVEINEAADFDGISKTLCRTKSGEIMMTNSSYQLGICNPKERTFLTIHDPISYDCQTIAYTESLVSPNYN